MDPFNPTRKLKLWEMEHWRPNHSRPSSAERQRRIAQKQREMFDRKERIAQIEYPFALDERDPRPEPTVPYVSPCLERPTFSSMAKMRVNRNSNLSHNLDRSGYGYGSDDYEGCAYRDTAYDSYRPTTYRGSPHRGSSPSRRGRSASPPRRHYGPGTAKHSDNYSGGGGGCVGCSPQSHPKPGNVNYNGCIGCGGHGYVSKEPRTYYSDDYASADRMSSRHRANLSLGADRHLQYTSWGSSYAGDEGYGPGSRSSAALRTAYAYDDEYGTADPPRTLYPDEGRYGDVPSPRPLSPRGLVPPARSYRPATPYEDESPQTRQPYYGAVRTESEHHVQPRAPPVRTTRAQLLREQHALAREMEYTQRP